MQKEMLKEYLNLEKEELLEVIYKLLVAQQELIKEVSDLEQENSILKKISITLKSKGDE